MRKLLLFLFVSASFGATAQTRLNIDSLFNWQDTTLAASTAHHNTYNEIWGYAKNGKEYGIIGTTAGTHIFDVTQPALSHEVAMIPGAVAGSDVVHRDFHDFQDYLYIVCDEGASTLQIADLRFLPDSAPLVYDSDALFPRSHNIFIDSSSARMYVCGGPLKFAVFSLANPIAPTLLLNCPIDVPFWNAIDYVHDVYVRGDTAYLNAGTNGLFVVDFRDINNPVMIGSMDVYPQSGYNHSGWLMPDAPYYALADETHGKDVKIVDVSDYSDMFVVDTISSNVSQFSIPHNLIYRDHLLFISYYFDGMYMFDCSDPAHPQLAGFYDTSTEIHQNGVYRGCWGVYPLLPSGHVLASDMQTGLWIFGSNQIAGVSERTDEFELLDIYPNPADNSIFFPSEWSGSYCQIIDMSGKAVWNGKVSQRSLDIHALATGLYSIVLQNEDRAAHARFVKF